MDEYLKPSTYMDFHHPAVAAFYDAVAPQGTERQKVVALYYAVRDKIRYNPYTFAFDDNTLKASFCFIKHKAYCIPKAVLFVALARKAGVPARLGLADVENHMASPQFVAWLGTNYFAMHGYTELFLGGKWVKATPAFDAALCATLNVAPLEWDGYQDSLFQENNLAGERHMTYAKDHGVFADVPVALIMSTIEHHYPNVFARRTQLPDQEDSLENDMACSQTTKAPS